MSKETFPSVGNKIRKASSVLMIGAIGLSLAGCSTGKDPNRVSFCSDKEAKGTVATPGSKGVNDPNVILQYADKGSYRDETAGTMTDNDYIDGLGELVCQINKKDQLVSLRFLPSVERIRHDYLTDLSTVQNELNSSTTTTTTTVPAKPAS